MLGAVLSGFLLAALAPKAHAWFGRAAGWLLALLPLCLFLYLIGFSPEIADGGRLVESRGWVPRLDITLSFQLDGLSLLFALLITGIGTLIIVYAGGYLKGHPDLGRFYAFILMFMASMLGLVLADGLVTLFVFWELTSVTSYLLIGFDHQRAAARRAALQALVVTGGGGLALLAGLLLMGAAAGSWQLSEIVGQGDVLREHPLYTAILLLVLGGAFTKSAQVPFHVWLPNAMEAPTPVSAYLHSATMVKAGVYLLARLSPALGGTELWSGLLVPFGAATLVLGAILAIRQSDLKLMLAYTTVASLGLLVLLLGLNHPLALQAALLYLFAHALFKGALFMIVGAIDHETGRRDVTRLGGLAAAMPLTAAATLLAALSMAGLPPAFGFLAKEGIYAATLQGGGATAVTAAAVLGNALLLAVTGLVAWQPFFGRVAGPALAAHEAPVALWLGPMVLALLGIGFGVWSGPLAAGILSPAASSVANDSLPVELGFWHGLNAPLLLSIVTVLLGSAMLLGWRRLAAAAARLEHAVGWGPDRGYDQALSGLEAAARRAIGVIQTGSLRRYLMVTFVVTGAALAWPLFLQPPLPALPAWPDARFYEWAVAALILAGALATVIARSRLASIAALGLVGYGVALIFLLFGAPDLAFTQLMVETLAVVIIALVLLQLPLPPRQRSRGSEIRDAIVAIGLGGMVSVLMLQVGLGELDLSLSTYFADNSYVAAHGRNIVNVILVDFRALDTLGEITVVMVAGLAVLAVLKGGRGNGR